MRTFAASADLHLVVIAKSPLAGRVKTRLCPPYSLSDAARLAEAALIDTLAAVAATPAAARTLVLDGPVGSWLPTGFSVIRQRGTDLAERLAAAFDDAQQLSDLPVLVVGMDTPQLTPSLLAAASATLRSPETDAVLGPATDGGWWALGLRRADNSLLLGVPMSTPHTYSAQLARLQDAGLTVAILPKQTDVDDAASAELVAGLAPATRFAHLVAAMALEPV